MSTVLDTPHLQLRPEAPEQDHLREKSPADLWVDGFLIVHRESGKVIGTAAFKGPPDAEGVVELAYGIVRVCEGRGYATEAAAALTAFASGIPAVRRVRAHTLPGANASTRVLSKCGFALIGEVTDPEDGLVWRWERDAAE